MLMIIFLLFQMKTINLLSYNKDGTFRNTISIPKNYSYIPQNIYSDEKSIYMLMQSQKGNLAIGYYKSSAK